MALAAAVYPIVLAGVILIVGWPAPLGLLLGFWVGGIAISVVTGYAIVKLIESSKAVSASDQSGKPILDIVAGAASLVLRCRAQPPPHGTRGAVGTWAVSL